MIIEIILRILLCLMVFFVASSFVTLFLIAIIVKKDIEKRYKTVLDFPLYMRMPPYGFLSKYCSMAMVVIRIYLTEKNIIKKSKRYNDIFLIKMKYTTKNENKLNIFICFFHIISLLLMCIFTALSLYIGSTL